MTLATINTRMDYVGNGATSVYPYTFKIFAATDLLVTKRDTDDVETTLVLNTDYTVSGAGDTAGGSITLTAGNLTTDYALTVRRVRPLTQETDIRDQGDFYPEIHEDVFDDHKMVAQQQQNDLDRAVKLPETVTGVGVTLPMPEALKIFRWNSGANALEAVSASDITSILTTIGFGLQLSSGNLRTSTSWIDVTDPVYGADPTGASESTTAIQDAIDAGNAGDVLIPKGNYLITSSLNPRSGSRIIFEKGAVLLAGANNLKIFHETVSCFGCQIIDPHLDGNGYTGVYGFDLTNFRQNGAAIIRPFMEDMEHGIYARELCWDLYIEKPTSANVDYPITLNNGSNATVILHPALDTGITGIKIIDGANPTVSTKIVGGYIQNFTSYGVEDTGRSTEIDHTYFEGCTLADIYFNSAIHSTANSTQHYGSTGAVCFLGESSDSIKIENPYMGSSQRTTGLYDFDGTNTNCQRMEIAGSGSTNTPLGTTTGIVKKGAFYETVTFTPVIEGTSTAGAGTYSEQTGYGTKIGDVMFFTLKITWSAHTGTGNMIVAGLPFTGYTGSTDHQFTVRGTNLTFSNNLQAVPLGTTSLGIREFVAAGADSLVAIDTAANLVITGMIVLR